MNKTTKHIAGSLLVGSMVLGFASTSALAGGWGDEGSLKDPAPERKLELSANVAFTSDYVFRGFSQSAESFAVQGGFDASYGILYVGTWASSIDFGSAPAWCDGSGSACASAELDVYGGIKPTLGPINMDLGVIGYLYPNSHDVGGETLNFLELKAGASVDPVQNWTIGGTVFYSPEYTGGLGDVWTLEGKTSYQLPAFGPITPTLSATLGDVIGNDTAFTSLYGDDYVYWNAGISFGYDKFSLDLRYWDTDLSDATCSTDVFSCDERFVATFSASF